MVAGKVQLAGMFAELYELLRNRFELTFLSRSWTGRQHTKMIIYTLMKRCEMIRFGLQINKNKHGEKNVPYICIYNEI